MAYIRSEMYYVRLEKQQKKILTYKSSVVSEKLKVLLKIIYIVHLIWHLFEHALLAIIQKNHEEYCQKTSNVIFYF